MPHRPPLLVTRKPTPRRKTAARGYGWAWRKLRRLLDAERPAVCVRCGRADVAPRMHLDHCRPRSAGGTNDPTNLQWLCAACHSQKTAAQDGGFGR
jgi:5-methylcytosine-specific restriction protein A